MACVKGIADYSTAIISNASSISHSDEYLPLAKFHEGIAGILKQGVERLDNVRQQAGEQLLRLLSYSSDRDTSQADRWRIHGDHLMHELFLRYVSNFIILRSTLGLTIQTVQRRRGWMERKLMAIPARRETSCNLGIPSCRTFRSGAERE